MRKFGILCIVSLMLCSILAGCSFQKDKTQSASNTVKEDLSQYFTGFDGCFLLLDQNQKKLTVYNEPKTNTPLSPCSTFKIVNTLIGLETKVLVDEKTVFTWNGTHYANDVWNQDQTLAMAVSNSTFWYFQRVASLVGSEKMQTYINKMSFGNKDISGGITQFWEQSSLKISPREWLEMFKSIWNYQKPIEKSNVDILKKVLRVSEEKGAVLFGKTGSGMKSGNFIPQGENDPYIIGWFVGCVEKEGNVYYFVTNIEGSREAMGGNAKKITLEILKDKGIF